MWWVKFIPGIGSLIQGGLDFLNKKQDVDLEKYKVDGQVDMTLIQAEIEITKAKAAVATNLSFGHYCFIIPTAVYYIAIVFDSITEMLFKNKWDVQPLQGWAGATAMAVVTMLFLQSGIRTLARR